MGRWVVRLYGCAVADPNSVCLIAQPSDTNKNAYSHPLAALDGLLVVMGWWLSVGWKGTWEEFDEKVRAKYDLPRNWYSERKKSW
jgi:hypothetical protein